MELAGVVVHLAADGGAALRAHVVVLAAGGEHQQELLRVGVARRQRGQKSRRLELLESVARPAIVGFYTGPIMRHEDDAPLWLALRSPC